MAAARHTETDALLPTPAPRGIVERSVYRQPADFFDPSDRKRYRNEAAAFWWTLRSASGLSAETTAKWGWIA